jgi:glutathione transport system substrate-binding protein
MKKGMETFKGLSLTVIICSMTFLIGTGFIGMGWAAGEKDVLTVALGIEPTSLDPHQTADLVTAGVQRQIYNHLFAYTEDMKIVPQLAESYKVSPDKRTWTLSLRKGVKFQNGQDFTAATVKFSIERIFDPATNPRRDRKFQFIESGKVIGGYVVAITTKKPFGAMMRWL